MRYASFMLQGETEEHLTLQMTEKLEPSFTTLDVGERVECIILTGAERLRRLILCWS